MPVAASVPASSLASNNVGGFAGGNGIDPAPLTATDRPANGYAGSLESGSEIFLATPTDTRWRATVDGAPTTRSRAAGWANTFVASQPGQVELSHSTPGLTRVAMALQLALWVFVLMAIARMTVRVR